MKRSNITYFVLVCLGFLLFVLGGVLLIAGVFINNTIILYIGLGLFLGGLSFYVALGVLLLIKFLKGRKK